MGVPKPNPRRGRVLTGNQSLYSFAINFNLRKEDTNGRDSIPHTNRTGK